MEITRRQILIGIVAIAAVVTIALVFAKSTRSNYSSSSKKEYVAKVSGVEKLPKKSLVVTPADQAAYDELSTWVEVAVQNQPATGSRPQKILLPEGWTAREDYLLTVLPDTMPLGLKNYRAVIMRPPKGKILGKEDAIYTVSDASDSYFAGKCRAGATESTCYGGKNADTKHVFETMFHFAR